MIRHVVLVRWRPGATEEQVQAVLDGLGCLPTAIPEIGAYRFGPDVGLRPDAWDLAITGDFADADAWRTYVDHPAHQRVVQERIAPISAERVSVQFEL